LLIGGTGASSVPLPSWAWSNQFFGSAKVQASYSGYGVKNLVRNAATLPNDGARIKISYSVNNPALSLRLIILDSGGGTLYNNVFAENVDSSTERTANIDITNTTTLADANKFEIMVESDSFTSSDIVYITDFMIMHCTELPDEPFDPDYQAILDYATSQGYTLPSSAQQVKQNQLVLDLKSAGAWKNDLDLLYVFATDGDRNFAKINWISPGTFQATEHGTVTFHTNSDFQGDASTGYILPGGWVATTNAVKYTLNDACIIVGVENDVSTNGFVTGSNGAGVNAPSALFRPRLSTTSTFRINTPQASGITVATGKGFFQLQRTGSSTSKLFSNGSQLGGTVATGSGPTLPDHEMPIFANNNNGTIGSFTSYKVSFYAVGASLSGKESALYTAWNTYFSSL
jgi:hypothetical protein